MGMPLIVVLRDNEVEGAIVGAIVDRVRGDRADHVDAFRARGRDCGCEVLLVLGT